MALTVLGSFPVVADARHTVAAASAIPLQEMTFKDAERVGAVGTGCTWKGGPGQASRLSMADDRASVKRNGRVVALTPAPGAKALFLTYAGWVGEGMRIVVRDTGRVVRRGRE